MDKPQNNDERRRAAVRRWNQANPEKMREYRRRWEKANRDRPRPSVEANRALILAAKDRPCVDCGQQLEPKRMHFDHVRGEKSFDLAGNACRRSQAAIEAEIAKCDVRCALCHGRRHSRGQSPSRDRKGRFIPGVALVAAILTVAAASADAKTFQQDQRALREKVSRHPIPDYITACESHGYLHAQNPSGAGGRYQIMPSTWEANLPRPRPVRLAGGDHGPTWSSRLLQDIVAHKVARSSGLGAWSCA